MIVLAIEVLALITFSVFILFREALARGVFTWHFASLGLLCQKLVFAVCALLTFINVRNYALEREAGNTAGTFLSTMTPLMVLLGLAGVKLLMCRVDNGNVWMGSIVGVAILLTMLHERLDENEQLPSVLFAFPLILLLLVFAMRDLRNIWFLSNPVTKKLYYFEHTHKVATNIISCCAAVAFIVSLLAGFYMMEGAD